MMTKSCKKKWSGCIPFGGLWFVVVFKLMAENGSGEEALKTRRCSWKEVEVMETLEGHGRWMKND